jgi:hypothetical protein
MAQERRHDGDRGVRVINQLDADATNRLCRPNSHDTHLLPPTLVSMTAPADEFPARPGLLARPPASAPTTGFAGIQQPAVHITK